MNINKIAFFVINKENANQYLTFHSLNFIFYSTIIHILKKMYKNIFLNVSFNTFCPTSCKSVYEVIPDTVRDHITVLSMLPTWCTINFIPLWELHMLFLLPSFLDSDLFLEISPLTTMPRCGPLDMYITKLQITVNVTLQDSYN